MRTRRFPKLSSAHLIALIALFVSLGGTSFAMVTVTSKNVKDNSLKSVDLKNGKGVKGKDVVPGSISGGALQADSITSDQLANGSVGTSEIANGAIDQTKLQPASVNQNAVGANAINSERVQNSSLRGEDIQPGTVGGGIFAPGSVVGSVLAGNTVTGSQIDESTLSTVPTAGGLASVTAQRQDFAVGDGSTESSTVYCPSGQQAIGGGARAKGPLYNTDSDVLLATSRPARSADGGAEPNDGETFDGWRASVVNQAGGNGSVTASVWVICAG